MIKKEMSIESASPETSVKSLTSIDRERMISYKLLAAAFSYPDERLFEYFPQYIQEKQNITAEYDRLFRAGVVWLYGAEHLAKNEFQRANILSDIMGFYKAFGLEPDRERPDSITCEMEFMHALIFKRNRICSDAAGNDSKEKYEICRDAEKKFFIEHLEPTAKHVAEKIIAESDNAFYFQAATELLEFMETEKQQLTGNSNRTVRTVDGLPMQVKARKKRKSHDE